MVPYGANVYGYWVYGSWIYGGSVGVTRPYYLYPGDMVLGRIIKILPYRIKKKK